MSTTISLFAEFRLFATHEIKHTRLVALERLVQRRMSADDVMSVGKLHRMAGRSRRRTSKSGWRLVAAGGRRRPRSRHGRRRRTVHPSRTTFHHRRRGRSFVLRTTSQTAADRGGPEAHVRMFPSGAVCHRTTGFFDRRRQSAVPTATNCPVWKRRWSTPDVEKCTGDVRTDQRVGRRRGCVELRRRRMTTSGGGDRKLRNLELHVANVGRRTRPTRRRPDHVSSQVLR